MRLIGVFAYAAILVGIVLLGMRRTDTAGIADGPPPELPESLVTEIMHDAPPGRHVIVMTDAACGSPFRAALNYLHHLDNRDFAVITGSGNYLAFRMLEGREGVPVVVDDDLVARVLPFGSLVLIERPASSRETGPEIPQAYQFKSVSTAVLVTALDEILGAERPRPTQSDAIQQNLQPVSASNSTSSLQPKASRTYF